MHPLPAPPDYPDPLGLFGHTLDGRYLVRSVLAEGDTGVVYHGEVVALRQACAIKVLRPEVQRDAARVRAIVQGCQRVARLRSEWIVAADDILAVDGRTAIITPMLAGEDLAAHLRRVGRLSWPHARELLVQICSALYELHAGGLCFGGLKPGNIFLASLAPAAPSGVTLRLLDVGVSQHDARNASVAFMSPEQLAGSPATARSDVYNLAALAFELLSGQPVFVGVPAQVAAMHRHKPARSVRAAAPDAEIPAEIDALLLAALAKDPHARPVLAAFHAALTGTAAAPAPTLPPSVETPTLTSAALQGTAGRVLSIQTASSQHDTESTTQFFRAPPARAAQSGVLDDPDQITSVHRAHAPQRPGASPARRPPPPPRTPPTPFAALTPPTGSPTPEERTQLSPSLHLSREASSRPHPGPMPAGPATATPAPGPAKRTQLSPAFARSSSSQLRTPGGEPPGTASPPAADVLPPGETTQLSPAQARPSPASSPGYPPLAPPAQPATLVASAPTPAERTVLSASPTAMTPHTEVLFVQAAAPREHTETALIPGFGGSVLGASSGAPGLVPVATPAPLHAPRSRSRFWARLRALWPTRANPPSNTKPGFWARFRRTAPPGRLPARRSPAWLERFLRGLAAVPRRIGAVWRLAARPFANLTVLRSRFAAPLHAIRSSFTRLGRLLSRFTGGGP